MATLEDKILGEKTHYYCSSSEDSDNEESEKIGAPQTTSQEVNKWEGASMNTGPKGVIEDWRKFKQLEVEKRVENEQERVELAKKLTMTVRTVLDEEKAKNDDEDLAELMNDEFFLNYRQKRIEEMMKQTNINKIFGELTIFRTAEEFIDSVDNEDPSVTVIIHIYDDYVAACRNMNLCLKELSSTYDRVKFGAIVASKAGASNQFKTGALPALIVYKAGNVIGNFVRVSDELGSTFQVEDVQSYLVEHGLLEDKTLIPAVIRTSRRDSDSD